LGSLKSFTVLLTLGAWGAATDGAPFQGVPGSPSTAAAPARPDPPAPPRDYVKAAAWLVQTGDGAKAAQYLRAAEDYRDLLTADEQASLDSLKAQLGAGAPARVAMPAPTAAAAIAPIDAAVAPVAATMPSGTAMRATPGDKQSARWLLQQARDLASQGRYDEASQKVAEARGMDVRWTLFDDTPDRVAATIAKARPKAVAAAPVAPGPRGDRREAKARLKAAREQLSAGQLDAAEAGATEVASWGHKYGVLEDSPDRVLAAVRSVRRRDLVRKAGAAADTTGELYSVLVGEARTALGAGQVEVAEAKALQAQRMNVVPALTADRAEAVLHDIALVKARSGGAGVPVAETPAAAAEREGNALLAAGNRDAAAAKFVEAQRLQAGPVDPQVLPVQAEVPGAVGLTAVPPPAPEPAPALAPAADPTPVLAATPAAPAGAPAAGDGAGMLAQAQALLAAGSFAEAKALAEQARAGGLGVDAQANDLIAQIALAQQGGALKLYEAALDAVRKQEFDRARALLTEIGATETQDEALTQKVQDLLARLPGEQPGQATLGAVTDAEAVLAQKMNVEVGTKVAEARRLLETDPGKAIVLLEQTKTGIEAAEVSDAARKTMVRRLEVAIELAKKDKLVFDEKMKDKAYRAEIEQKRLRILEADNAKLEQVAKLMEEAQEAEAQGDYAEAEQKAKRAAEIDPNNVAATALATVSRIKRHYERDKEIQDGAEESALTAFQDVSATAVVPDDVAKRGIAFPKDFSELTRSRRELMSRFERKKDPKVLAVEEKLNEPVTLNMDKEQPLGEVVNYLSSYTGLNIVVDPKALAEEGLTLNTPVALVVRDVKLKAALKFILSPLNLTYRVDDESGVVQITNPQASRSQTYPVAYPVADLIISPHAKKKQNGPGSIGGNAQAVNPADPNSVLTGPNGADASAALNNQGNMMGGFGGTTGSGERNIGPEDYEPLIQLIRASIAPGSWKDSPDAGLMGAENGGYGLGAGFGGEALGAGTEQAIGTITPFFLNISLIIRHTSEVHDEVQDLLRQLRRLQDLQISVEVRFITVSDSFFEQIGVDFDFGLHSDVVGPKSSFAIPNPDATFYNPGGGTGGGGGAGGAADVPYLLNPSRDHAYPGREPLVVGTQGATNSITQPSFSQNLMIPFLQSSSSAITPFNALTSNVGAQFGLAFLSDLEVYLFLQAVQGDTRSNLVQAPKVTTFNGAPAFVVNTTSRNYVQALVPVVGAGAVAFSPSIGQFQDGVQLFVTPVVSADRRYVRMTMSPIFQTLIQFDTFTIPAAVGGGGLGGQATGINAQVQLPVFSLTTVSTTVTVPDGGTVLMGGVKRLREERREFGVPILAKTPLINRLFRNIGIGRTTDSLMIMVTPRIIILEEEEERLGIPAVNQGNTF
jgi:type II secretory pathway component GspD/PulD (secretin)/tetratricopeptide (TPR) repeat protein